MKEHGNSLQGMDMLSLCSCACLLFLITHSMMIVNLLGKPLTIGLACVAIYFRIGGTIPGMNFGRLELSHHNAHGPTPPLPPHTHTL